MNNTIPQSSRKASDSREGCVSTPTPAPIHDLILLGVDTHAGHYTFARKIDHLANQPPQKLTPEKFLEFLPKQRTLAKRVVMVYEAGPYGFALYRQVQAMGIECLVCAPERMDQGRRRVTDKTDATELLNRLDRYLSGNTAALRRVSVPTLQQEMARRLARERNTYRKDCQRWISRGRSLLHTLGVARPGAWWKPHIYSQWLQKVEQRYDATVRQQADEELTRYREMLAEVQKKLAQLTEQLRQAARAKSQQSPARHPAIKGLGALSAELLDREMGDWNRFANRRQVASYTGLCPGEASSGDSLCRLSIDKHGNPRVRAVLVECAWLLGRYQPAYKPLRRWKAVLESGPTSQRKKAAVALGRRLVVDLWRIRTGRCRPEDVGLVLRD